MARSKLSRVADLAVPSCWHCLILSLGVVCWVRQTAEPTRVFSIVSFVIMYDTNSMLMTAWKKCSMPWHSSSKKTASHRPDHLSNHPHIYNSILFPSSSYISGWVGNLFKSVKCFWDIRDMYGCMLLPGMVTSTTILDDDVDPFAKVSMRGKAHRFMR